MSLMSALWPVLLGWGLAWGGIEAGLRFLETRRAVKALERGEG